MDNNKIKEQIEAQLEANGKALDWAHVYLHNEDLADLRQKLITNRIRLKRILYANAVNPAAAVFGESQVGKSYMVDCLLTSDSEVLNVYDGYGKPTGFLEYINPFGGGKEATSLITRFTTETVWKDKDYPVRAMMLTPIDVVIVLVDAYYNDVCNHELPKSQDVTSEIERLAAKYHSGSAVQSIITEDEIFELREYFTLGLLERGESFREALLGNGYFEQVAEIISAIPVNMWPDVFSFLWNRNDTLTDIFERLLHTMQRMNFSRTVYIKIDAVLREPGTILHVDRLYELFGIKTVVDDKGDARDIEVASVPDMDVCTEDGNKLSGIRKSEFCALAMELAFTIVNPTQGNSSFLKEKPFLDHKDILDFPGARSRKRIEASIISEVNACEMLIRGKVAYLFNKYSQQYLITNLLFCHHDVKSEVTTLSSLLKGWVDSTVGSTPEARAEFMKAADVPPLFLIGTKFNIDLEKTPDDNKGNEESREKARHYRWTKRFGMLNNLIAPSEKNDWFEQWVPRHTFDNIYLLRSFEYSCQRGLYVGYEKKDENGLWKLAYNQDGTLQGEQDYSDEYKTFIPKLKESFLQNGFVRQHFAMPEKSWNEAVEVGKDGSAWIIENLTRSSRKMSEARETQFGRVIADAFSSLITAIHAYYHDDNADLELQKQMKAAGSIALTFDVLFGRDKYFFSDFISAMTVDEEYLHDVIMDIINATKVVDETDLSVLFAIRAKANVDPKLSFDENKERVKCAYNCSTDDELYAKLKELGVKLDDIINPPKVMNFSRLISDAVEKSWVDTFLSIEHYREFVERGAGAKDLQNLLANTKALYKNKIKLSEKIAKRIHPFVSASSNSADDMTDMLADICAEMINTFVNTMGAAYYNAEMWKDIDDAVKHNEFDISVTRNFDEISFDAEAVKESLPNVFDSFDNVDQILNQVPVDVSRLKYFSNYCEYYQWVELMKVSFLATQGIPKYNQDMNNALRTVFSYIVSCASLKEMVSGNSILASLKTVNANEND